MKMLSPRNHGIVDYISILFLAQSAVMFDFEGIAETITYWAAIFQLLLTMLTKYEFGIFKLIPFKIHGFVELIMSLLFVCIAFYFNRNDLPDAFYFYFTLVCVYGIVLLITNFAGDER